MDKKEKIILATLELASEYGLRSLSMSQIAEKVGIKKPSLYNHFESKEILMKSMYEYLRMKSKINNSINEDEIEKIVQSKSVNQILMYMVTNYMSMINDEQMHKFYKVVYSERSINSEAAKILIDETNTMILATKGLFQLLNKLNKIKIDNIEIAAITFSMTIHSLIDYELDCKNANVKIEKNRIKEYIDWFCDQYSREE